MKRAAACLCVAMAVTVPQAGHCLETMWAVKAGPGHYSYCGPDYQSYLRSAGWNDALNLGFAVGVSGTLYFSRVLAFQPEVLLMLAGDTARGPASDWGAYYGWVRYNDRVYYLGVPALLKLQLGSVGLLCGPTALFRLTGGKLRICAQDDWLQEDLDYAGMSSLEYAAGVFAPFLFAAAVGIDLKVPLRGSGVFLVDIRGHYVFSNVLDPSQGQDFDAYGILFMVGYGIDSAGRERIRSRVR